MFDIARKTFQWGQNTVTLETGEIARQASGAVLVNMDDTVVLASVVGAKSAKPGQDFFPLTVDYVEKFYAAGRIPGGFFKREGRPTEREILICRLIDRPIRPLFPDGFYNEVQVIVQVVSSNPEVDSDIPAMIAASAALAISGVPFAGPIGAARVGYVDGQYVLNPRASQMASSQLDLVVAGTDAAVLMVDLAVERATRAQHAMVEPHRRRVRQPHALRGHQHGGIVDLRPALVGVRAGQPHVTIHAGVGNGPVLERP